VNSPKVPTDAKDEARGRLSEIPRAIRRSHHSPRAIMGIIAWGTMAMGRSNELVSHDGSCMRLKALP
jgi:hypothetical protein